MIQKSLNERRFWAQFDALEMGTGWDESDITKPQIMVESVYGDSHPGSTHLNQLVEQAVYGVYEKGGKPPSITPRISATAAARVTTV